MFVGHNMVTFLFVLGFGKSRMRVGGLEMNLLCKYISSIL